jgi:dolichyl-diphosphooligosaccharide--protein glycosyltransferase
VSGEAETEVGVEIPLWLALGTALALLVGLRLYPFPSVFRGSDVVLLSNDPYFFLYLVERVMTEGAISRANPEIFLRGEPLLIWTLAFFSFLLGGVEQADVVLAWYPVVTALVSGLLVFVLARTLTDDVRIGLTAVVVLAVTPLHVSRTALGFADHHAFDYMWLILTATALTWLVVRTGSDRRRRWVVAGVLGFAIAGQTLAWQASPLLLVPTAGAVGAASLVVVQTENPGRVLTPVVAGFGLAALLVQVVHQFLAWQSTVVAGTPVVLALGGLVVLGLVEGVDRANRSWPALLGAELVVVGLGVVGLWLVAPEFIDAALARVRGFTAYIERFQTSGIGETAPITATFGPVLGPLVLLGFSPFVGLPSTVWGIVHGWRERDPGWLVLAVYVLWFLALAFVQRRWAVQLGLFLSLFAAVGFVAFAHWLALVHPPVFSRDGDQPPDQETIEPPDRQRLALLGGLGVVGVGGSSIYSGYILSQLTIEQDAYRAAVWMREYAAAREWSYPQNYVLAAWGRVRMFNYLVNGQSREYVYARRNYEDFIFGSDPAAWYERFSGRVGFVVTRVREGAGLLDVQAQLHDNYGSASNTTSGVGHYRAMWESEDGSITVFTLVPGATVSGTAPAETPFVLSTSVTLAGSGSTIEYRRRVEPDADGTFSVVLAHPGEYEIADRSETLAVDETAVREGREFTMSLQ